MPKSKKPAGGRAQDFEPRYGKKTSYQDAKRRPGQSSAGKPGSKSPNHRGHRTEEEMPQRKQRWTAQDRAGREDARGHRGGAREDRPAFGERPQRGDRPAYGDRPHRDFGDRSHRSFEDRGDRGARTAGGRFGDTPRGEGHRPARRDGSLPEGRGFERTDRPHRGDRPTYGDRTDRPRRDFGDRTDRPRRDFDDRPRGDRPSHGDRPHRGERPAYGDRGHRSFDDRGARTAGGRFGDTPRHGDHRPARRGESLPEGRRFERTDRPQHTDRPAYGDRPHRGDRPAYGDRTDRPRRDFDDRPRRDHGDRPSHGDRPRRDFGDRPSYGDRPHRSFDDRGDRGARTAGGRFGDTPRHGDHRPARRDESLPDGRRHDRGERPQHNDRPHRGDRPAYGARTDRPAHADRPHRDHRDVRPNRSDWNADQKAAAFEEHVDVVHERLQAEAVDAGTVGAASFSDLGLGQNIVKCLAELGAPSPFPIQAATIGPILEGRDVLARGRTGSGKTIAFGAPLVESILRSQAGQRREFGRAPKALILAPTRELALQIDQTVQALARSVGLFTTQVYGGVPQARQVGALKKGVDIVIGTPGRIEDLQAQGKLDLSDVRIVVLDEADHMSELGFLEPMQRILRLVADGAQKLLFSATLDREVAALVDEFLVNPAVYEVAGETQETGTIDHRVLVIDHRDKAEILSSLVDREGKTLVFARTRAYAEMLAEQFNDAGIAAVALHGDLNQAKRTRNLKRLTDGKVTVLVATDVAARGIHVDDIDLVIQADAPDEYKTYLHRSGRTGRAGHAGTVVTLVTRQRRRRMQELLDRADIQAPFEDAQLGDDLIEELSGRQLADVTA